MSRQNLRKIGLHGLSNLQEDGTGNLYWRGRRLTAADSFWVFLIVAVVGAACDLMEAAIEIGEAAGWW